MTKPKETVAFSLDSDLNAEVGKLAESMGISKSQFVNMALRSVVFQEMSEMLGAMMKAAKPAKSPKRARKTTKTPSVA